MEFKQSTLEEIAETELAVIREAASLYGEVFETAHLLVLLFSKQIQSIDDPEKYVFVGFHNEAKKHLILALLSAVRRHHVQTGMDMRQVLEAGAWAAYAMAHREIKMFCATDADEHIAVPKRLVTARNRWLNHNYPTKSAEIKRLKDHINESSAHANIIYAATSFHMGSEDNRRFETPVFDVENRNVTLSDLWFIGNTAQGLIDLFHVVNETEKVFQEPSDFAAVFLAHVRESDRQRLKAMQSPEYKRVTKKG